VRRGEIIAVRDTEAELRKALGDKQFGLTLFHVHMLDFQRDPFQARRDRGGILRRSVGVMLGPS
jgi:hypothetical protein